MTSLYTNVPLNEAIQDCTELLYSGRYHKPPVDRQTFIELVSLCSCNVVLLTNDGFYRQVDGLAMGSPPAPQLENDWMSKFDERIKGNSTLYSRYMEPNGQQVRWNQQPSSFAEIYSWAWEEFIYFLPGYGKSSNARTVNINMVHKAHRYRFDDELLCNGTCKIQTICCIWLDSQDFSFL